MIFENFLNEREKSLTWLQGLDNPDWDAPYQAHFGLIRAGDIFVSWVTHDHLHMRQIIEIHRHLTAEKADPYRLTYAGDW